MKMIVGKGEVGRSGVAETQLESWDWADKGKRRAAQAATVKSPFWGHSGVSGPYVTYNSRKKARCTQCFQFSPLPGK